MAFKLQSEPNLQMFCFKKIDFRFYLSFVVESLGETEPLVAPPPPPRNFGNNTFEHQQEDRRINKLTSVLI